MRLFFFLLGVCAANAFAASDCERAGNNAVLCSDGELTSGVDPLAVDAAVLAINDQ